MIILIYNNGQDSRLLSDCFRKKGVSTRLPRCTVDGLIKEIDWGKPFAVMIPPEIPDGSALLFIQTAEKKLSGRKPLFFVYGLENNLRLCSLLRKAGAENVFLSNCSHEQIVDSVLACCEIDAENNDGFVFDWYSENKISKHQCLGEIRRYLKKNCFDVTGNGGVFISKTIMSLLTENPNESKLRNVYRSIAQKERVSVHLVEQDVRNAILSARRSAMGNKENTIFSEVGESAKTKEIVFKMKDRIAEEIKRTELKIFGPINRVDNG